MIVSILDGLAITGGISALKAGRDGSPPSISTPGPPSASTKTRWIPPSCVKRDVKDKDNRTHSVFRHVRGILNKLTPEKFDKLSLELINVGIDSEYTLKGIILLIFEKALDEPKYSSLYAQLCKRLSDDAPNFEPPESKNNSFRLLLISKCRDEFDNRAKASEEVQNEAVEGEVDKQFMFKKKMLANIKFIGELGKLDMLHTSILHRCIQELLEKKKTVFVRDMGEDLECLCQILRTAGANLDTPKAKLWMDQYYERILYFSTHPELPARIQFTLQDTIDLRKNKWKVRRVRMDKEAAPKTITEIRKAAADEHGTYMPSKGSPGRDMLGRQNGFMPPTQVMGNMFPLGPRMGGGIGTGPGVIQMDGYIPGYSHNLGRPRGSLPPQQSGYNDGSPTATQQAWKAQDGGMTSRSNNQSPNPGASAGFLKTTGQIRELPPRFQKMATTSPATTPGVSSTDDEVSLRPKTFALKPTGPSMLPKSAQLPPKPASLTAFPPPSNLYMYPPPGYRDPMPDPLLQKQAQITIKPMNVDKLKNNKKQAVSREEAVGAAASVFDAYLAGTTNTEAALTAFRDLTSYKRHMGDMLSAAMLKTLGQSAEDQNKLVGLLAQARRENLISSHNSMEAFQQILEKLVSLETETPLIKSQVARYAALAVTQEVVTLAQLAEPMAHGAYYPLFLLCLQQIAKVKDHSWLTRVFHESKVHLMNLLPEADRKKERLVEILDDRGLSFMLPLLRIQADLLKRIREEPTAGAVYKWVKEKVDVSLHQTHDFINILTTCFVKYITEETSVKDDVGGPEKAVVEQEKTMLQNLKGVLQKLVHEDVGLQVTALYAVQVYCHSLSFPKGMVLRFFMNLYDLEVVEEEAYLQWKEEINDTHPGKGKALIQVNQWLMWLEQAEEEDTDED